MNVLFRPLFVPRVLVLSTGLLLCAASSSPGQATPPPKRHDLFTRPTPEERARIQKLSEADHADMMRQLGLTALRPGRDGSGRPDAANAANYDEALANPYPDYPDALTMTDGSRVTDAKTWFARRRPEIVEDFEREVVGRIPAHVPSVRWVVTENVETRVAGRPVVARRLAGVVDNTAYPEINVEIGASLVYPADAKGPVPVLIMFGSGNLPGEDPSWPSWAGPEPKDPPSSDQLIAAGWGYVSLNPGTIQPDNGAGLTEGIIGLVNKGEQRKPEDWGALRAWGWGASRVLDYLATEPKVDAKEVGIEGVSRFGKAALVAMAFDTRFAIALIGSSGEGGAKPHRRNFGEAVENLTGGGGYHWMAGNFLKYGAEEPKALRHTPGDLPVDAHELIALCAPRPVFISYGIPEKGDAKWLDQQGSYMATVAASEVYRLLGASGIADGVDYRKAKMPPPETELLSGELAWRQHTGGHEDRSNMRYFIAWANRELVRKTGK
jgi:hypothetical protein